MREQLDKSLTARLYQAGLSAEAAVARGADLREFEALEVRFAGGSIPAHLLRGFAYQAPYSCDYHTGGSQGAQLRAICASLRI